ncbi:MAG TPA: hypothetical protein VGK73_25605, partial [Polyangiaceae bacterium]
WARLSSSLVASDGVSVGATGYRPDIAAAGTGYAMAWATGSGIGFMRYATNGNALCEHGLVDLGLDAMGDQHRVALADTEFGTLVLVTSEEGKVSLVRFDEDCQTTGIVPVANTASAGSPALAVGGGSVALAWVNRGASIAHTRLAGERLCE